MIDLKKLDDKDLAKLIDNRWGSASSVWSIIDQVADNNITMYEGEKALGLNIAGSGAEASASKQNRASRDKVGNLNDNRIFVNTESVINTLIANPPKPNVLPATDSQESKAVATSVEKYLSIKFERLNVRDSLARGLRYLYFTRMVVLKPFWNNDKNDFDVCAIDPRKVRFAKDSTNEESSHFAIEEVTDGLSSLIARFPDSEEELLKTSGYTENDLLIQDPQVTYKECWVGDYFIVKYKTMILKRSRNPYWDWDGVLLTKDELDAVDNEQTNLKDKIQILDAASREGRTNPDPNREIVEGEDDTTITYEAYRFNYFDRPRKPYIFATVMGDEKTPIGRTSLIEQATPLQKGINHRKKQIHENADVMNGVVKVESGVMKKAQAMAIQYNPKGVIWGKGVTTGVSREAGVPLPNFVFEDMQDSRQALDNIMAVSSAFRGEREGQETMGGRLALIERSFFRLNEMVQLVDYLSEEMFAWWMQMMKSRYTERHYVKYMGDEEALKAVELTRNDIEDGLELRVIPGKTLPNDRQFRFERAQQDFGAGALSLVDYLEEAGYESPLEKAKNAVQYAQDPMAAVGLQPEPPPITPPGPGLPPGLPPAPLPQPGANILQGL